jgi:AcrR family transcriptional regulator
VDAESAGCRTFATTSTVAYAGRMTAFTKEWLRLGPERAAEQLRRTIAHLLHGPGRVEDRLTELISGAHPAAFPGCKEALLTKVLSVAHADRFLPLLTYSTAAGGKDSWTTFNAGRDELLWYYTSVERAVASRLPGSSIGDALRRAVDELVAAAGTERSAVPREMPVRG